MRFYVTSLRCKVQDSLPHTCDAALGSGKNVYELIQQPEPC